MFSTDLPDGANLRERPNGHATLAEAAPGDRIEVCSVRRSAGRRRRLLEMGFVSGAPLRVVRHAMFGDPIQVEIQNYHLSLRKAEAAMVAVERVFEESA